MKSEWLPCDFKKACLLYDHGHRVRCEMDDGVLKEYQITMCELKPLSYVFDKLTNEWEWRND